MIRFFYNFLGRHIAAKYAGDIRARLSEDEWAELVALARAAQRTDPLFRAFTQPGASLDGSPIDPSRLAALLSRLKTVADFDAAMMPEAVLSNPVLNPYRRPAFRLLPEDLRATLSRTPIVATPRFRFEGFASKFRSSGRYFIQIPFGMTFVLRPLAEVSLGTYLSDSPESPDKLQVYLDALRVVVSELDAPSPQVFVRVNDALKGLTPPRLGVVHFAHLIGVFLMLHELGHVGLKHWTPDHMGTLSTEECIVLRNQEIAADRFAAGCILRTSRDRPVHWDDVREMHILWICQFLSAIELHLKGTRKEVPQHYPTFEERRLALLESFQAPHRLRSSVQLANELFARAVS